MIQNAALFLALRYLRPQRSFVSVITIISVLGIAVGVLMMIVVRAVMMGFESDFRDTLMGAKPHVLFSQDSAGHSKPWPEALQGVKGSGQVQSATAYAGGILYLSKGDLQTYTQVFGIASADAPNHLRKINAHLIAGSLDLVDGGIVLVDQQAQELGLLVGDDLSVYASQNVNEAVRQYSDANDQETASQKKAILEKITLNPQKLKLTGILKSETAGYLSYMTLATAQSLFHLGDGVTGIALELPEPKKADQVAKSLIDQLPGWKAKLWSDDESARLAAMGNEQTMMQFVLSIIALVAAFSVMNTTITITMQKRREIGVIAALGGRPSQIINVFLIQAVIVGVLGTGLGLLGSLLALWLRNDLRDLLTLVAGGQVHAVDGVFLSSIPALLQPWDVVMTCSTSILLCIVAGLLPAWVAARVDPAVALRD
jgi:lipoprotein-releasing system permease protein